MSCCAASSACGTDWPATLRGLEQFFRNKRFVVFGLLDRFLKLLDETIEVFPLLFELLPVASRSSVWRSDRVSFSARASKQYIYWFSSRIARPGPRLSGRGARRGPARDPGQHLNPPHLGHLVCAQEAIIGLGLDRVLLVPVGVPPHKEVQADPGIEHRVELCRAAVAGDERLGVSRVDADRRGRSYSVDTLRGLHERAPEDELTFIVGGDLAHSFPDWHEPEAILELAELGVAERQGIRRADIAERLGGLQGGRERVRFFDMPRLDVSSSLLRRRAAGEPIRYLVPEGVERYIAQEGLYRHEAVPAGMGA